MGSKKKSRQSLVITGEERWQVEKPRYNPYQTGHGAHGSKKYSRKQKHKEW